MTGELVERADVLDALFDVKSPDWLPAPVIQRCFRKIFGDMFYKSAMDDLRIRWFIEHEMFEEPGTSAKYWRYRRRISPPR